MADVSIDEAKARQWINEVNNEVIRVEELLTKVTTACTSIPGEDDDIMKGIENTCTTLTNFWTSMCNGFKSAGSNIEQSIDALVKAGENVVEDIENVGKKIGS